MSEGYIVTNFAYGTGPYLRTTELAIAFNDELERRGKKRMPIIVPLVYGERQRLIMREEFSGHENTHPSELLLAPGLGAILKQVFYGDNTYREALEVWIRNASKVSLQARQYLSRQITVETLSGKSLTVDGKNIAIELNRSPRIRYDAAPSYLTTFGYIAQILGSAEKIGQDKISVPPKFLREGARIADWVEGSQGLRAVAYPATFSALADYKPRYPGEFLTPPLTSQFPAPDRSDLEPGIFVTVTGIPGLERLYKDARKLGLELYTTKANLNDVSGSRTGSTAFIGNKNICLQFARAGWGSIWLSLFLGTPLVVPEYDSEDDPEIYFNNQAIEKLGLGVVWRGEPLSEILPRREKIQEQYSLLRTEIEKRWGTLDGHKICVSKFADNFLNIKSI